MLPPFLASSMAHAGNVDTQFIFGFTQGSDVGEWGRRKSNRKLSVDFGKADGSYAVLISQLRAELTPFENFRVEVGAIVNYSSITGVNGFDDRNEVQFGGFALEGRYRLFNRRRRLSG